MTGRIAERLRFEHDRTVTVLSGKVELGQGLSDALTLICSEELALEPNRIRVRYGDTAATPDDGLTAGSGSMERAGAAVRTAARAARHELIHRAAERLGVPPGRLEARSGMICRRADDGGATRIPRMAGTRLPRTPRTATAVPRRPRAGNRGRRRHRLLGTPRPEEVGGGPPERSDSPAGAAVRAESGHRDAASEAPANRAPAPERNGAWRRVERVVRAGGNFVHDLRLPGMVHGRVLRPPGYRHRLSAVAADAARAMRGVLAVVVDGSFVAVAAEREEQAVAARDVLAASARWQRQDAADLPPDGRRALRDARLPRPRRSCSAAAREESGPVPARGASPAGRAASGRGAPAGCGLPAAAPAATVSAVYSRPFLMHASLGPSAAAARLDRDGGLTIWSHTQGPYELRAALAEALHREPETIRVIHVDGAGCYGHNGADDVALDAALLALAVPERPVLVTWSREDEHRWEPYGTAMIVTCSADLDAAGSVTRWRHDVRSHAHSTRPRGTPGRSTLLAAWHRAAPLTAPAPRNGTDLTAGPQRNAEPLYDFPDVAITTHFVPAAPVRVSALRSLGAFANVFAIESFMDELAARRGEDPLAYRLRHLHDERARRVLTEAVHAAHSSGMAALADTAKPAAWAPSLAGNDVPVAAIAGAATISDAVRPQVDAGQALVRHADGSELLGRGMAVARYKNLQSYAAVVCDVAVDPGSGRIRLLHAAIAADAGRIIDRDGLANQLEGGFLQAASWTLKEEVRWDRDAIRSTDWDTYPVLRFSEVPPVTVRLVDRPDLPSVGAGEAAQGPTPAAIANAVYAAAGIRLRHTPFTPPTVMSALSSASGRAAAGAARTQ